MVYNRKQSKTIALLDNLTCPDVSILIEAYLLPKINSLDSHLTNFWRKLSCGFAEYVEMEIGNIAVIENMFIDACKCGTLSDVYALLSAGARNLKSGLAAAVLNDKNHIAKLLIALDATDSSRECPELLNTRDPIRGNFIAYAASRTEDNHLLSMIGSFQYPDEFYLGIRHCVMIGSIYGLEIVFSKMPADDPTTLIRRSILMNDVLINAVNNNMMHIIEYALDNGADIKTGIDHANKIRNVSMINFFDNLKYSARDLKRRRI